MSVLLILFFEKHQLLGVYSPYFVIPAKAGIQVFYVRQSPRLSIPGQLMGYFSLILMIDLQNAIARKIKKLKLTAS
jgi:hypothetical protein